MFSKSDAPPAHSHSHAASISSQGAARQSPLMAGVLFVFVSSVGFSTKAILVKLAYRYGVSSVSLLALRFGFSAPFFALLLHFRRRPAYEQQLTARDAWAIVALGVLGYYAASLCDFVGLRYISAGLERLILFVYPTLVVLVEALFFRVRLRPLIALALLLTYAGIGLAFHGDLGTFGSNAPLGALWVFGSALTYALYLVGAGRLVPRLGSQRFTGLALLSVSGAALIHTAMVRAPVLGLPLPVYGLGLLMSVVATVLPAFWLTRGIELIGSGRSAIVSTVGPVSTILLAYFVLHEAVSVFEIVGTVLVLFGATLVTRQKSIPART